MGWIPANLDGLPTVSVRPDRIRPNRQGWQIVRSWLNLRDFLP